MQIGERPSQVRPLLAVFVHVHYPEIWEEICDLLAARLAIPFDLVITTSISGLELARPSTPAVRSVRILEVENRGRDILPFLRALQLTNDFDVGLKLHTKKSALRADGGQWREALLNGLLPSRTQVTAIFQRMIEDPRAGFVAPAEFCLSVRPWVLGNAPGMVRIMSKLGTELLNGDLDDTYFAAGSMFWFRRKALAGLAIDDLLDNFEPETGQVDDTMAHAMERLFPVEARRQGYVSMAVPALLSSNRGSRMEDLLRLARRYADLPTTFFPGPNIAALPPRPRSRLAQTSSTLWDLLRVRSSGMRLWARRQR